MAHLYNHGPRHSRNFEIDREGRRRPGLGFGDLGDGGPWLLRGDVEQATFEALPDRVEIRYRTTPVAIEQDAEGVTTSLLDTATGVVSTERFDLVAGADGLRSTVRWLAFGPPEQFLHRLDSMIAAFAASPAARIREVYGPELGPVLESAVATLEATDPTEGEAEDAVFADIFCNDIPWHGTRQSRIVQSTELGLKYPLLGWSWVGQVCDTWRHPADVVLPTPTGKGLPPILMVQDRHDPATPYEGALQAHKAFANSRMVHIDGVGDHCVYLDGIPEVDNLIENFFLDGVTPPRDSNLHAKKALPVPSAAGKSTAAAASNALVDARQLAAESAGKHTR